MFNIFKEKTHYIFYSFIILFIILLYCVRSIILPFFIGLIIAYFFKDIVAKYEYKISRHKLSLIIIAGCFVAITLFFLIVLPVFFNQTVNLLKYLVNYFSQLDIKTLMDGVVSNISEKTSLFTKGEISSFIDNSAKILYENSIKYLGNLSNSVLSYSLQFLNTTIMVFLGPIMGFYFLRDWDKIMYSLKYITPIDIRKATINLFVKIDEVLHGFLTSQILVCVIFMFYYSILLYIVGLKYGFSIGLLSGFLTFLPYIGSTLCAGIAFFVAMIQYNFDIKQIAIVMCVFFSGSFIEGNFVTPNLVGDKIRIHPLWIMFSLFVGGVFFGFTGILFSMPIAGVIGVIVRFYFNRKKILCLAK